MLRRSPALSKIALLLAAFMLAMLGMPAAAQDDGDVPVEPTANPGPVTEPAYGILAISAVSCAGGGQPGTGWIALESEYVPPGDCVAGSAAVAIDGIDYGGVSPYLEVQLPAGLHGLLDQITGAYRDIDIPADSWLSVVVVSFVAPPEPTTEPTVAPAAEPAQTGLTVVAHACKRDVQSADQLYALGGRLDRLNACPAMTLPGYSSPAGTVDGGERWFDGTFTPAVGAAQSLSGSGSFVPDFFCESGVGSLDADPTNDRCVSTSGFAVGVPDGPMSLALTAIPDDMRFVAAEMGNDADAAVVNVFDPAAGYVGLDTTARGTDQPVLHLFFLDPPQVSVVVHVCGPDIDSAAALANFGGLAAQALTCPAIARPSEGGPVEFWVTVSDAAWGTRSLDAALFDPTVRCEADIGDWNGDPSDNACFAAPTYRFDRTAMGYVAVGFDASAASLMLGGAASADPGVVSGVDLPSGQVVLDTSFDGDATIHLFAIGVPPAPTATPTVPPPTATQTSAPPSATPTQSPTPARTQTALPSATAATPSPTATPSTGSTTGAGTVLVAAFYCLSGSGTTIVALPPGQQATSADIGGSSCFAGNATIQLLLYGNDPLPAVALGRDGVESIQNVPATSAQTGAHTISDQRSGRTAVVEVAPGTVTRVIVRYGANIAMIDESVSSSVGSGNVPGAAGGGNGGLVTDELIGDAGVNFPGSYSGISFTSLVVENLDAQAVSSVTDARSLPGVGTWRPPSRGATLTILATIALGLAAAAGSTRRRAAG